MRAVGTAVHRPPDRRHGRDDHGDLRRSIAHDCPRMQDRHVSPYERCGVHFPELRAGSDGARVS
jgi:hypothetical protein